MKLGEGQKREVSIRKWCEKRVWKFNRSCYRYWLLIGQLALFSEQESKKDNDVKMALTSASPFSTDEDTMSSDPDSSFCDRVAILQTGMLETGHRCLICSEPMDELQPIYISNNKKCGHSFHANCMESWLKIQNTCPLCNEPFAILTTGATDVSCMAV